MSLLQKVKDGMGSPDWNLSMINIHLRKLLRVYCPKHAGVNGNDRADRLVEKATLTSGLLLGRPEVFRLYLRAQSQGHHTIDRLEERCVGRGFLFQRLSPPGDHKATKTGFARQSSLKGRERAIVNQMNIGTVSKSNVGETSERRG